LVLDFFHGQKILKVDGKDGRYSKSGEKCSRRKVHMYDQKKPNLFTVLVWFFVNFARKVSLEIFDKQLINE
jgi:hypothetical protein